MKTSSLLLSAAAISLAAIPSASAVVLAAWDVDGIDLNGSAAPNSAPFTFSSTTTDTSISSALLTLSSTVDSSTANDSYGFKISTAQNSLSNAITAGHYFQFTLDAAASSVLNLTDIEMNGSSSSTGANDAAFLSSVDSFTSAISTVTAAAGVTGGLDTDSSGFGGPIDLSGAAYQGLSSITFRFYGWNTSGSTGSTSIRNLSGNDLVINGTSAPSPVIIPEPHSALLALGGVSLITLRRKRSDG